MMELSFHPNGFLQVDGGLNTRLHVWSGDVPRQKVPTLIHNHRFSFTSKVLHGTIINIRYRVHIDLERGAFTLYRPESGRYTERDGRYTQLVPTKSGARVRAIVDSVEILKAGDEYKMEAGEYHESRPLGLAVTWMTKVVPNVLATPFVLVPYGVEPDNEFQRETIQLFERLEG